jgi:hypothetical protein
MSFRKLLPAKSSASGCGSRQQRGDSGSFAQRFRRSRSNSIFKQPISNSHAPSFSRRNFCVRVVNMRETARREAQGRSLMPRDRRQVYAVCANNLHRTAASRRTVLQRFDNAGPRFTPHLRSTETRVSQLLAGTLIGPGRSPGTARVRACEARPQAPHLAPPFERLRTAPSSEQGYRNIIQIIANVK